MDLQYPPSLLAETLHRGMNGERGARRPFWIIAVSGGRAEYCHHAIADVLVYRAAVAHDDIIDDLKIGVEKTMRLLRIEDITETGESERSAKRTVTCRRSPNTDRPLMPGERRSGSEAVVVTAAPQPPQNFTFG